MSPATLSGKARLAGVMGWPVGHSRSPRLHGFWLAEHGIDGAYVPLAVRPEHFAEALRALPRLGFRGVNVTIPHKQAALALADRVDPLAKRIGAANTIMFAEDGALEASNTDAPGFLAALAEGAPDWSARAAPAVVLGAGGAARAVIAALAAAGAPEIRVVNRTADRAAALAREFGGAVRASAWEARESVLEGAGLLVNTTALGMAGQPPLGLGLARLPREAVVNDVVYVPLETELLATARARGNRAVDGLGMLLHQAAPGFAAWFGVVPRVSAALRAHVLDG